MTYVAEPVASSTSALPFKSSSPIAPASSTINLHLSSTTIAIFPTSTATTQQMSTPSLTTSNTDVTTDSGDDYTTTDIESTEPTFEETTEDHIGNRRRLLSQMEEKTREDAQEERLQFHADDDADALRSKRKKRHWRSRIMLQVSNEDVSMTSTVATTEPMHVTSNQKEHVSSKQKERFQGVYVIIAVFLMLMGLVFTYFFCTSPAQFKHTSSDNIHPSLKESEKNFTNYILVLLFIFYFLYVGGEVGYGGFIYSFAIDEHTNVNFTSDEATQLNSVFWGTFALGRGLSICIASLISPLNMVLIDIVGCIVSSLVLAYEANTSATILWVGTATLGASMASLFPSGISWLESHAPVTGNMASFLIIGAAFGEMAIPLLLGNLFDSTVGPMSLMYVTLAIAIATAGIFGCTVYLAAKEGRNYDPLPKEDVLEGFIMEVKSAIDDDDEPTKAKQATKPFLPKPLQKKKHKE